MAGAVTAEAAGEVVGATGAGATVLGLGTACGAGVEAKGFGFMAIGDGVFSPR
jgi:hypothetical protein